MKYFTFLLLIIVTIGNCITIHAQPKPQYLSASKLRSKLMLIANTLQTDFSKLKGKEMVGGEYASKTYSGTVHFFKNDYTRVNDAVEPGITKGYKVRVFITQNDADVENVYRKWEQLFEQALPEYYSTATSITTTDANKEIYRSFYSPGSNPIKIEIGKKILFSNDWGMWIEISLTNDFVNNTSKATYKYKQAFNIPVQPNDLLVHRRLDSKLTSKHPKTIEGGYYTHMPLFMKVGDIAYIVYRSKGYIPKLIIRDSLMQTEVMKEDDGILTDSVYDVRESIKATHSGVYDLIFTSWSDPEAQGKFTVDVFHNGLKSQSDFPKLTFCEKLKYIGLNSTMEFQFIDKIKIDSLTEVYAPSILLVPNAKNTILKSWKNVYRSEIDVLNLESAQIKFHELEQEIETCLNSAEKKIYTKEELGEPRELEIIQRVDFTIQGASEFNITDTAIKYIVSIIIFKAESGAYWLELNLNNDSIKSGIN